MKTIFQKTRESISPCVPPLWARSGHAQTILAHLLPSEPLKLKGTEYDVTLENERERIRSMYLKGSSKVVVYLFHGLAGSAEGSYMQRTASQLLEMGHHVFLNNHRGCGNGVGLATEPYHSGRAEDLSRVIAFGKKMLPDHVHIAVGFSLSANALLLLAAGIRAETQPDFAIAVNGPINLDRASVKLREGLNRIYDHHFTKELKKYVKVNRPKDAYRLPPVKNLREFDELITAPIGGFKSRADYYGKCSAGQFLKNINIPTVIITSYDDPFVSVEDYLKADYSEKCFVHLERNGGHMGYLTKKGRGYERWLDGALTAYISAFISSSKSSS